MSDAGQRVNEGAATPAVLSGSAAAAVIGDTDRLSGKLEVEQFGQATGDGYQGTCW